IRSQSDQAHVMLGRALRNAGDADGAIAAFQDAIKLNPNRAGARDLARVLAPPGRLEEARAVWEQILEANPSDHDPWYGYAQLCAFLGTEEAYHRARQALLQRFGDTTTDWVTAERTGLACLLLPPHPPAPLSHQGERGELLAPLPPGGRGVGGEGDEFRRTIALVNQAVAAGPKFPRADNAYLQFVNGLAEYRQGRPEEAVGMLEQSAALLPNRAGPRLALALAQFRCGSANDARATLARAVRAYNWEES